MPSVIGYENLFTTGTVTASSEESGYPIENAYDGLTWDFWQPTSADAGDNSSYIEVDTGTTQSIVTGYFGLAAHNLADISATVTVQGSNDAFAAQTVQLAQTTPADNRVVFLTFSDKIYRYFRVLFTTTGGGVPVIGVVMLGRSLVLTDGMEPGFVPPVFSFDDTVKVNSANNGAFLGRSIIRKGSSTRISMSNVDPDWMRTHWLPFLEHARTMPFLFSWDTVDRPNEAAYCWTDKAIPDQAYTSSLYMGADLPVKALL